MAVGRGAGSLAALLLLLCSASTGLAQSETGASIIQTTVMEFRLTGSVASNFSTSQQTQFSNQLRALLQSFNFMSVAVSDYSTGPGYVDVSVRAVDATDAQNLTSTWQTVADQVLVSNTFMTTFNALLTNAGVQGNATLTSIAGATTAAGTTVVFDVNMTVSGDGVTPFSATEQQALLTPLTTFLGDHGTANISNVVQAGSNETNVTLLVSLDANTMPQFWFFIVNQSAVQTNLKTLQVSNVTTSVSGFTIISSSTGAANAPTPSATAPVSAAVAQAPISSSQALSPVTAAEVTGSPSVPPVSSSTSGTVTMNIAMTLYGSDVQPFTSDVQFNAASAMAGVFWIIIGTGSVQLISFDSTTATSEPSSTAQSTTQQYGRKLLQASSNSSSNGTSIPAESVVFAVTLPSATQNSLLVLQSASPTVRQQFAGWFVTQMQARGYNIDANVESVSVSTVTGATSPPPTNATTPAAPASTSTSSSGSSTNVGAIVGGVVGGVVGVAALALLGMILYGRHVRKKAAMDMQRHKESVLRSSPNDSEISFGKPTDHLIYTRDADLRSKAIISLFTDGKSFLSSESPLNHSPLYSRITELDSAHVDDVRRLLHKRQQQESAPLTETSQHQAAALLSALSSLETGSLYYDKYVVDPGQRRGVNSIIAYASLKTDPSCKVVIKFLPDHEQFKHEKLFYENRQALEGDAASAYIPVMMDFFSGSPIIHTADDDAIPPSIVLERGNFTLTEWLSGRAVTSIEGKPEEVDRPQTLYNLCKAVDFLHARSLVHGCLAPDALMWFAPLKQWKLIGFGNWAKSQEPMRISYDLRYAAPELLHADLVGMRTIVALEATDMWALGAIAFELLSGKELFGAEYSDEEVMSMLLGFVKLPWEENADFFTDNLPPEARNLVGDLLRRAPEARKPIRTVLASLLFSGGQGNGCAAGGTQYTQINTPAGILSTASQWE